jgi:hypothetical protein
MLSQKGPRPDQKSNKSIENDKIMHGKNKIKYYKQTKFPNTEH